VSVEEHSLIGGLGSAVAEFIAEAGFTTPKHFRRIGLPDAYPTRYGSQASQLEDFGVTAERVEATVAELCGSARTVAGLGTMQRKGDGKWQSRMISSHPSTQGQRGTALPG
jgi:hypothetical protein